MDDCSHDDLRLTFMVEAKCKKCGKIVFKVPQSQWIREHGL